MAATQVYGLRIAEGVDGEGRFGGPRPVDERWRFLLAGEHVTVLPEHDQWVPVGALDGECEQLGLVLALDAGDRDCAVELGGPAAERVRQRFGGRPVAYFSAEYGIQESLPIYAGGLGVLAGDHLKAASDLGMPLVRVGLRYRQGYFHQALDVSGWQVERYRDRILPSAQESLQLTRQIYEKGESNFIALLTVQRTYFQTNMNYLEALRELRTAEAELEGLLLSGSLEAR